MGSDRQVDRLLWAVAEAHRLRAEQERRAADRITGLDVTMFDEGFVTEWQAAGDERPLTLSR